MADVRLYRARRCSVCQLRFPVVDGSPLGERCPRCGETTEFVDAPYRTEGVAPVQPDASRLGHGPVRLRALLDNVRSLSNVGAIFRTADGAGIEHLHLGGVTPTPAHPKLAKTALGAERSVDWTHHPDAAAAASELVESGCRLWAIEGGSRATSLFDPELRLPDDAPVVLVLGHEVSGVDPRIVQACERVLYIPMLGTKDSLNVAVALGVAAYRLRFSVG